MSPEAHSPHLETHPVLGAAAPPAQRVTALTDVHLPMSDNNNHNHGASAAAAALGTGTPAPTATPTVKELLDEEENERGVRLAKYPRVDKPLEGLASSDAVARLTEFGRNELREVKVNPVLKFLSYFWGPIAWLIEVAIILCAVTQDWPDFAIILLLLFVNAIIGFVEEAKAESALAALRQTLALKSRVFRDSRLQEIDSATLVPGDIVVLRLGDIVPADCRLLGIGVNGEPAGEVHIDQSALTGESLPVVKHAHGLAYSSSIVKQGQQLAEVVETGEHTFIGRAATLIAVTNEMGHFQIIVNRIGNFLIGITLVQRMASFVPQGRGQARLYVCACMSV
jgi:magnesium-transporting ATPase (P-type)